MQACASAHFWARQFEAIGHEVRLIPPQHVKAYVRGNKNDYNDARAIAEAARRPDIRFVAVKTVEHQDTQANRRLQTVPGYGLIVASVYHAVVGNGQGSRKGRGQQG